MNTLDEMRRKVEALEKELDDWRDVIEAAAGDETLTVACFSELASKGAQVWVKLQQAKAELAEAEKVAAFVASADQPVEAGQHTK